MRRRDFILTGGAALLCPQRAALAQPAKSFSVGVLVLGSPPPEPFYDGLRASLREIGYSEGSNLKMEIRSAEGRADLLPTLAAQFVRLNVDVIVAYQTPATLAASKVTSDIPIVMAGVGDPVGTGLVASLARPGGNITGSTAGVIEVAGKIVELIREFIPSARRFAVLANEYDAFTKSYLAENDRIARSIGMEMEVFVAKTTGSLDAAFESMVAKQVAAVVIQGSMVRRESVDLAIKHQLPSFSASVLLPRWGGLMSYSAGAYFNETAHYVDKILKGQKPVDMPVSFPSKFDLTINARAAKVLGLEVSPSLLARAQEVIE